MRLERCVVSSIHQRRFGSHVIAVARFIVAYPDFTSTQPDPFRGEN
jgi:hypothetical protein